MRLLPVMLTTVALALVAPAFAKDGGGGGGGSGGNASVSVGAHGGGHGPGGLGASVSAGGSGGAGHGGGKGAAAAPAERGGPGHGTTASARGEDANRSARGTTPQTATAADLGKLNAAHASLTGRTHAASNSAVGQIRSYEEAKVDALAMPQSTPAERAARAEAIARANAQLDLVANKPVTPAVIAQVDSILGIAAR